MTASRKALADLWTDLQRDLDAVPDLTVERHPSAAEQRFPGDMLATLKRRAEDEAQAAERLRPARGTGEWLWVNLHWETRLTRMRVLASPVTLISDGA